MRLKFIRVVSILCSRPFPIIESIQMRAIFVLHFLLNAHQVDGEGNAWRTVKLSDASNPDSNGTGNAKMHFGEALRLAILV